MRFNGGTTTALPARRILVNLQDTTVLKELGKLIERISSLDSTSEIYDCIVHFIPRVLPADHVTITHYDTKEQQLAVAAVYDDEGVEVNLSVGQLLPSFSSYEIYSQSVATPIIYQPSENLDREINRQLHEHGFISVLVVPLISGLEIIGTLNIASKTHGYLQEDKFRLEKISALLATSISHNRAFESNAPVARHRLYAQHLEHLNVLSEKLLAAESVQDAMQLVGDCAVRLVNARRVSLCELDENPAFVTIVGLVGKTDDVAGTRIPLVDSGLETSLLHNQSKYTTDLINSKIKAQRSLGMSGYNHLWSFPIVSYGTNNRCLNITSADTELHIDDAMSVLDTLARLANSTIERIVAQRETIYQAKTDPLTGLYNRKEFNEQLESAIENATNDNQTGIVYLDLDLFKNVNDTMGHLVGDAVLIEIAERIRTVCISEDTLARIGGDEFMILLKSLSERQEPGEIARQLIEEISKPINVASQEIALGGSAGVCLFPKHGKSGSELIRNADIAMYKAKEMGRNQYVVFTDELANEFSRTLQLQKDLAVALEEDQLSLVYQPQFDIKTLQVAGVEVLVRWHHPTMGSIPPDLFIPIAENCGLIGSVTDWVLKHGLQQLSKWHEEYPNLRLAVNISAVEFSPQLQLVSRINNAIDTAGIDATKLEIELTETAFLKYPEHAAVLAKELTESGIRIALDDFGTGFASLSYLIQLPITCLKIDRSFVDDVENDNKKQSVIKGVLKITSGLEIDCLAEGVETQEQLDWLKEQGCNSVQGYLLSKPVDGDSIPPILNRKWQDNSRAA